MRRFCPSLPSVLALNHFIRSKIRLVYSFAQLTQPGLDVGLGRA
ncbi:hypothetical protein [Spirosoma spitsbergense]|nr:hypothetical protein [Spirosoma spitsbergense]